MISTELMGGIGNRMFQIAAIEDMGRRTGLDVYYADIDNDIDKLSKAAFWTTHAHEYLTIFKNFDWRKNQDRAMPPTRVVKVPFKWIIIYPENNTRYIGYFQSEGYFQERQFILDLFEPSDAIKQRVNDYYNLFGAPTCSIHVRRNNYLKLSHIHPPLPIEYYRSAMHRLSPYGIERYLVFSDDMGWCKEQFRGDNFVFIQDADYIEMFLMARCNHNIIANSSFSWWGAYLNQYPNKFVIAPSQWFAGERNKDAENIVPWHWIKI